MYGAGSSYGTGSAYGSYGGNSPQQSYGSVGYSPLEQVVVSAHASIEQPAQSIATYVPSSAQGAYLTAHTPHDYFTADSFLAPGSTAKFVGDAAEIAENITEAFHATTGEKLPADIQITVLNDTKFHQAHLAHSATTSDNVLGFSLNSNGRGVSQVFVRAMPLDKLMLTIGHEIGHVLTPTLGNAHDEEAKAFAFSLAWMEAIKQYNIAGIGANILPEPAHNGLHDIAFSFVQQLVRAGATAWQAFQQLANNAVTITRQIETVEVS